MTPAVRLEQVQFAVGLGAPLAAPDALFTYSDTGYVLLGEIIETASGMSLAEAYPTPLDFSRLGLDATYLESPDGPPAGVDDPSHQYFDDTDGYGLEPTFDLYGGGGLVSTAEELAMYMRALLRGEVFTNPATLDTMLQVPAVSSDGGAMGIFRADVAGHVCWFQTGFWGTIAISCPDVDVTVAVSIGQAHADDYDSDALLQQAFTVAGVLPDDPESGDNTAPTE